MPAPLIYDVGMNNGDDTAFYLASGFRVVAIEADPVLAEAATVRFDRWVASGQLTILNVGIADHEGEAEFWICDANSEWNSFERINASRNHSPHHRVVIPVKTFKSILAGHGRPHFLKVDIEGYDSFCLKDLGTLSLADRPRFVSWENSDDLRADPTQAPDSGLNIVSQLGYTRFKLIDQSTLAALSRGFSAGNLIDSVARKLLRRRRRAGKAAERSLLHGLTRRGQLEKRFQRSFPMGCSGPWGEETPGPWLTLAEARATILAASKAFPAVMRPRYSLDWFDWHAAR